MALTEVQWTSVITSRVSDISPSLAVRRCLFGPVNHSEIQSTLQREMKSMTEENMQRWNFDFERGIPLEGRYSWRKIAGNEVQSTSSSTSITLNSRTCKARDSNCAKSAIVESNSSSTTITTTATTTGSVKAKLSRITDHNLRKRVTTNRITGFLRQKKPRSCTSLDKDCKTVRRQTRSSKQRQMRLDKFLNGN